MIDGYKIDGFFIPKSYDANNDNKLTDDEVSIFCRDNDLKYNNETGKITPATDDYMENHINKLNPETYSIESLRQHYPKKEYKIEEDKGGNIYIFSKDTKEMVLKINKYDDKIRSIVAYGEDNNEIYGMEYNKNGELIFAYNKDRIVSCPIANNIYKILLNERGGKLSTTDLNKLALNIKKITPEYACDILQCYNENYRESLIDVINTGYGLDENIQKGLLSHLETVVEEGVGYNAILNKESKINNKYYNGDAYFITQEEDNMTVINKDTGEETVVDLEYLFEGLPLVEKIKAKKITQLLPAEVIVDISKEADFISIDPDGNRRSFYSADYDYISLLNYNTGTIVHETGHALDFMLHTKNDSLINSSSVGENTKFMETFNAELQAFIDAGNVRHNEYYDEKGEYIITGSPNSYATWNEREMFAECYTLLMTGYCGSKDCILNYFPKTLEVAKEHLNNIKRSDALRHK